MAVQDSTLHGPAAVTMQRLLLARRVADALAAVDAIYSPIAERMAREVELATRAADGGLQVVMRRGRSRKV